MFTAIPTADRINADAVERAACRRLAGIGYPILKSVECSFRNGRMMLSGQVSSYYHKQIAQEAIRSTKHVTQVVNNLEVVQR
jgi:osmotically-inducible protein OsmY